MSKPSEELIWYFAYGSNMNPKVLKRRRVSPKASVATRLPGWRLTYDLRGFPFVEPSFADIEPLEKGDNCPEVQGVCHQITQSEWEGIVATEGGGGVAEHGYHSVWVDCIPVSGQDPKPIRSVSLSVGPDPIMKHNDRLHPPSRRYINLIVEGAKHYGLQDSYIQWLETHDAYNRVEHVSHKWFYYFALSGMILIGFPVILFFALNMLFLRVLPKPIYKKWSWFGHTYIRSIGNAVWAYHDALHSLFGRFGWIKVETVPGCKNIRFSPTPTDPAHVNGPKGAKL